jgi:hypothetical protein
MSLFDSASVVITPSGYKEDKLYTLKPDFEIGVLPKTAFSLAVTRATTATRVNSDGLIEVVPRNLVQYSEQFDNAAWSKPNTTVTANATTAPNGTLTADRIQINSATNARILQSNTGKSLTVGQPYTFSCWIKSVSGTGKVGIRSGQNGFSAIWSFTNEWVRYTFTSNAAAVNEEPQLCNSTLVTGADAAPDFYAWGFQIDNGSTATEYFPTTDRLDVPRLDYTNSSCPSILVEPQRTNLVTYSEQFDNSAWTSASSNATVTANNVISPDGTQNADKVVFGLNGYLYQLKSITSAVSATFSIYSKTATQKIIFGGASLSGTDVYSSINVGNGWFRQILTRTFTSGGTGNVQILPFGSNETLYFWGAQFEVGSYATSYIPTIASSVTRNADVISKTGISSLIGQTEGVMFIDFVCRNNKTFQILSQLRNVSGTAQIDLRCDDTALYALGNNNGINVFYLSVGGVSIGSRYKIAIAYKNNDVVVYKNGVQVATDTSCSFIDQSMSYFSYAENLNTYIEAMSVNTSLLFKTRLSNSELAQLTTI